MATLQELELALVNADKAGDLDAARRLAAVISRARQDVSNQIPDTVVAETQPQYVEPSIGEKLVGAGETALTLGTGVTGGTVGMIGGTLKGLAEQILSGKFGTAEAANTVEQSAMKGAQALTYAPRTQAGQEMAAAAGEALQQVIPITPMTAELSAISAGARAARPAVAATAQRIAAPVQAAAAKVSETAKQAMPGAAPKRPTPGTPASGGAAGVDIGTLRQAKAEELPVPIKLTEGQKTRQFEQQRFERETAKLPDVGEPLRERFAQQNKQLTQNIDAFIDTTGAEAPDLRSVGISVDKALRDRAARDKVKIRTLYKEAEKAGETAQPVSTQTIVDALNESVSAESTAPVLGAAKKELIRLGGAVEDANGNLVASNVLKTQGAQSKSGALLEEAVQQDPRLIQKIQRRVADKPFDYEQRQVRVKDITPSQVGEDYLNASSEYTAKNISSAKSAADVSRVEDLFPIVLDETGKIVDGNHRHAAATLNGEEYITALVPVGKGTGKVTVRQQPATGGMTLADMEQLRKFINKTTGTDPTNIKFAVDLKNAIDSTTEGAGGSLYKQARQARSRYAHDYENVGAVKQILGLKRGSEDRAVALEHILNRSIIEPSTSLDTVRQVRRLLQTEGDAGKQAWRELQGGTLQYIKDQALKNVAPDQFGNRIVSPAQLDRVLTQLDKTGKLDFVFGKKGAEQLRTINDVAKDVLTVPPGTVNTSNTASVLAGLMDVAISGTSGVPAPVMTSVRLITKSIKDAKTRAKVRQALGE